MVSFSDSPAPLHSVHFYDQDSALIQRLGSMIASAMESGDSALVVATESHRAQLASILTKHGFNVPQLETNGSLSFLNAHETLALFMVNGLPDRELFLESVGKLIGSAKEAARQPSRVLTVFGEMVAVLWEQGNKLGAVQLEARWNELLRDRAFHLHCAYPRSLFADEDPGSEMKAIAEVHSHVVGYSTA